MNKLMTMKMKFKKNQKGLTLIELLAVIVILGVIAAIAVPSIGGVIGDSKTKADAQTVLLIQDSALKWAVQTTATAGAKTVSDLVDAGYLASVPVSQVDTTKSYQGFTVEISTTGVYSITGVSAT